MIRIEMTNRFPEAKRQFEARFRAQGPELAKEVGAVVENYAATLAAARIVNPTVVGGYIDDFHTEASVAGNRLEFLVENTSDHAIYVERGRRPQQPVMAAYKDNAANRRLGRAGGQYVHHYKGMPPSGIFKDGQPDWARRNKIARDGFPGRHIFGELKARGGATGVATALARLGRRLFGIF